MYDAAIYFLHLGFHFDEGMQVNTFFVEGNDHLFSRIERQTFTFYNARIIGLAAFSDTVKTKHHVLRRYRNRRTIGRVQDVVRSQHQYLGYQYSGITKRYIHGHLVTVKVSVECGTGQWVQLDSFTFNQLWLECLDTQTVQCRRTV